MRSEGDWSHLDILVQNKLASFTIHIKTAILCNRFHSFWYESGFIDAFYGIFINRFIELAKSEILNDGSRAIAPELSEIASHPLISEKSSEVRKEAIKQKAKH